MKRLPLGGGHAHVKVLADLAEQPLAGWDVHLISPYRRHIYSGMLPGLVAGRYPIEACAIRLDALAGRAGVAFHETAGLRFGSCHPGSTEPARPPTLSCSRVRAAVACPGRYTRPTPPGN